jgi:hypothetical protein
MPPGAFRTSLVLATLGACFARDAVASDEVHACVVASDEGQKLRDDGKLIAAQERFLQCAGDTCPAPVRAACGNWRAEVEARLPSIVLGARDPSGHDLVLVRVFVDGILATERLTGAGLPIDPGPHTIRFESGADVAEEMIVAHAGEKDRLVSVSLGSAPATTALHESPRGSRTPPAGAWILGLAGGVAIGGFVFFGLSGQSDKDHLAQTCAGSETCGQHDVSTAHTKLIVADVLLGAGVLALVGAAYWTLASRSVTSP